MNLKRSFFALAIVVLSQSCQNKPADNTSDKPAISKPADGKKYVLTIYQDKYSGSTKNFEPDNSIDSVNAANDTVAYLSALKKFYNQKIIERKKMNYGQPKSFLITDHNGVDLAATLPQNIVVALKQQVLSAPDVKNMIEEYQKDSL